MHLFVDISSHGLGHLAITAPVLNALVAVQADLSLTIRSGIPRRQLENRIFAPFSLLQDCSDFGYVMLDALCIDPLASAAAYQLAHTDWANTVNREAELLAQLKPDLVLSNVSYLPLAGAAQAGIPAISMCSLNWADLFAHFFGQAPWAEKIQAEILAAYRSAQVFLRTTPGMPMPGLGNVQDIGTIAALGRKHDLGLSAHKTVLIAMGGIAHRLPVDNWPHQSNFRWLVPAAWDCAHPAALPHEKFALSFTDLLCSVDAIITKPGYGTFTEAACNGTPVVYLRRADWPEQDCLIDWLHEHGTAHETSARELATGEFANSLHRLWQGPRKIPAANKGIGEAVTTICSIMRSQASARSSPANPWAAPRQPIR